MAKQKSDGFQSAAGLIRYFDTEDDKALQINPWFIIGMCAASVAVVEILRSIFPV
ncbi:MAG: preprotein translocase subunit Sec61beta [Methanomassiliicoccales archaeon]